MLAIERSFSKSKIGVVGQYPLRRNTGIERIAGRFQHTQQFVGVDEIAGTESCRLLLEVTIEQLLAYADFSEESGVLRIVIRALHIRRAGGEMLELQAVADGMRRHFKSQLFY